MDVLSSSRANNDVKWGFGELGDTPRNRAAALLQVMSIYL